MKTIVPKELTVDSLASVWVTIDEYLDGVTEEQWTSPSGLPGWTVADLLAHIIGTESMLNGEEVKPTRDVSQLDYVKNSIGELNENWLDHYRTVNREDLVHDYRRIVGVRNEALRAMTEEQWNTDAITPAGPDTYGRFMRIRLYDCWVHEVDFRDALGLGEPVDTVPAEGALDEMAAVMPYIVGKKAAVPTGTTVTFDFVGLVEKQYHVAVDGRAALVPRLDGPADVTLTMSVVDYARLAGGRPKADRSTVRITGDAELGETILDNLHYMI